MSRCSHIYKKTQLQCIKDVKKGNYCENHYSNYRKKQRFMEANNDKNELKERIIQLEKRCLEQMQQINGKIKNYIKLYQ